MAWTTPKTDWYGVTNPSDGVYTGDRFNAVDFNRFSSAKSIVLPFAT